MSPEYVDRYPQHTKLAALEGKNQVCGEFLDWLIEHGHVRRVLGIERTLAEFFEIDLDALHAEKDTMLYEIRVRDQLREEGP